MFEGNRAASSRISRGSVRRQFLGALIIGALISALSVGSPGADAVKKRPRLKPKVSVAPAATTLPAMPKDVLALAEVGPLTVGLTTADVRRDAVMFKTDVWYPAVAPSPTERLAPVTYDVKDWLPAAALAKVGDAAVATYQTRAIRDRASLPGPYPVVLFSHGFGGYRMQSSDLMQQLASWGFVVIAPEHTDRDLPAVLADPTAFGHGDAADLSAVLAAVRSKTLVPGPLAASLDPVNIAVMGHSAGANAAISLSATDTRLKGVIALGGGASGLLGRIPEQAAPILWVAAGNDSVFPLGTVTAAAAATKATHHLVTVDASGHMVFADICEIGKDRGGPVGIAKSLGVVVPFTLQLLGTDGCNPPNAPVTTAWPIVRFAVVAQLRTIFQPGSKSVLTQANLDALVGRGAVKATLG